MNNFILTISLLVTLAACSESKLPPSEVLSKEQMIPLIVDIEVSQAIYKLKFANKDSINYHHLMDDVFNAQNTSQEQFNSSLAYYAKHPKEMEEIYNQAIVQLTQKQAKVQSKREEED